jgi:hypothetical protein
MDVENDIEIESSNNNNLDFKPRPYQVNTL